MKIIKSSLLLWLLLVMASMPTQAAMVAYSLNDVILDDGRQMTGTFTWDFVEGDFENGTGLFTDLFIPSYGSDISALTITFDIGSSIEFSLTGNIDNAGVDITLFLLSALTSTSGANLDLSRSKYSLEVGAQKGVYTSGSVAPVPVPATVWLFGSGLIGLVGLARRKA